MPNMDHARSQLNHLNQRSAGVSRPESTPSYSHTGTLAGPQVPRTAPFSPVFSDFTLPFSEDSLACLEPVTSQDFPVNDQLDHAHTRWSSSLTDRSYIDEPTVSHSSMFELNNDTQSQVMQAGYHSCFTPSDVNFDQYLHMDQIQGPSSGLIAAVSQTAGFSSDMSVPPGFQPGQAYSITGHEARFAESSGLPTRYYNEPSAPLSGPYAYPGLENTQLYRVHGLTSQAPPVRTPEEGNNQFSHDPQGRAQNSAGRRLSHRHGSCHPLVQPSDHNAAYLEMRASLGNGSPISERERGQGESDSRPRSHKFYTTARPDASGYYHCPYLHAENCNHKPTKLKCNYDKYVDSHLKPFVCKQNACKGSDNENRFSSTACLLRHEREAHGLHGHGNKPYLCKYDGCERAVPGNGFPRNYNLMDHMKRVHRYKPEERTVKPTGSGQARRSSKSSTDKVLKRGSAVSRRTSSRGSTTGGRHVATPGATLAGQQWAEMGSYGDELQQQAPPNYDFEPRPRTSHRRMPSDYH